MRYPFVAVKTDVMHRALTAKFTQHEDLQKLLLSTGRATLVEHTVHDKCWGDGGDGSGQNRLGKLLVQVRNEISGEITPIPSMSIPAESFYNQSHSYQSVSPGYGSQQQFFSGYPDSLPRSQSTNSYTPTATIADMASDPLQTAVPDTLASDDMIINFYNRDDPYYEFTNFFIRPIELDGKVWPTSEHFFQVSVGFL